MKHEELITKLKEYLFNIYSKFTENGGGYNYRYLHAERVTNVALKYANKYPEGVDKKALEISCLLHDIGKIKFRTGNKINLDVEESLHCIEGAKESKKILKKLGCTDDELIEKVYNIILNHHSTKHEIKEVEILQNSDDLDEFGYLSVWRMFCYSAIKKRYPQGCCDYWKGEYPVAKKKIEKNLSIDFFKEIGRKRVEKCNDMILEFEREANSNDF